jgi:hypothetical protein
MAMHRRAFLLALPSVLALGGCLRPDFRTVDLDATGTGSIGARYPLAPGDYAVLTREGHAGLINGIVPMSYPVRPGDTIVIKERFF